jgi:hypothetical protein
MKLQLLAGGLLLICLPLLSNAQTKTKEYKHGSVKTKSKPGWYTTHQVTEDKYVYFPDYYMFYEPDRGYVYWQNGKWTTSSSVPSYMQSVDLNSARIQTIDDMSTRPEIKYKTYMQSYPAQKVEITVPMPGQ